MPTLKPIITATLALALCASPYYALAQAAADTKSTATSDSEIYINFKDTPLDTILNHISKSAQIAIINDNDISEKITLISQMPLSLEQTVSLLNKSLFEKGYTAVHADKSLKIVTLAQARHQRIPVVKLEKLVQIKDNKDFTVCIIPVSYASATALKKDLDPLINKEYAVLVANDSSNSIIITDTNDNIRKLYNIIKAVDTAGAFEAHVKVIQLKNASATDTAKVIESIFVGSKNSSNNRNSSNSRGGRGGSRGGSSFREMMVQRFTMGSGANSGGSPTKGVEIKVTADERSNKLIITGPENSLKVIDQMVKELDSDDSVKESVTIYKAKYMKADELEKLLNSALGQSATKQTQNSRNRNSRSTTTQQSGLTNSGSAVELLGNVYVVSDTATNTIMIMTPPQNKERVQALIDELDRPIRQVLIKVLIVERTYDNAKDIGVEFGATNIGNTTGSSVLTDFGLTPPSAQGLIWRQLDQNWNITLRALQTEGKIDILSRPYILASENIQSTITVGQDIPLITRTRTTDNGDTLNDYRYEKVGIILEVTPTINSLNVVTMDVAPEISALAPSTIEISAGVTAPIISTREAKTRVSIKSGQTIVIGGMMQDQITETIKKIPFLGDIPGLGKLFTSVSKKKSKTELLIFITPVVVDDPQKLEEITNEELENTKTLPGTYQNSEFQKYKDSLKHLKKEKR